MHVLPAEEGLPDLPEEGSTVKKDPSEEGEALAPTSPASASTPNGNANCASANGTSANGIANEQSTIKANKGMILRKVCPHTMHIHPASDTLDSLSSTFDTSNSSCQYRHLEEETWKSAIECWRENWRYLGATFHRRCLNRLLHPLHHRWSLL